MDSLKIWIIWSAVLHFLVLAAVVIVQIIDFHNKPMMELQANLVIYEPEPEPEVVPTPAPEPTKVAIEAPTKRPTPKRRKTPTPTPTRNLDELKKVMTQIARQREQTPTPKATAAPTKAPTRVAAAQQTPAASSSDSGGSNSPTFSGGVTDSFKRRLIAELAASMSREAPAVNQKYSTGVRFTLKPDGKVKSVTIRKKSGSPAVDNACKRAVENASFPAPTGESAGKELTIEVTLSVEPD